MIEFDGNLDPTNAAMAQQMGMRKPLTAKDRENIDQNTSREMYSEFRQKESQLPQLPSVGRYDPDELAEDVEDMEGAGLSWQRRGIVPRRCGYAHPAGDGYAYPPGGGGGYAYPGGDGYAYPQGGAWDVRNLLFPMDKKLYEQFGKNFQGNGVEGGALPLLPILGLAAPLIIKGVSALVNAFRTQGKGRRGNYPLAKSSLRQLLHPSYIQQQHGSLFRSIDQDILSAKGTT